MSENTCTVYRCKECGVLSTEIGGGIGEHIATSHLPGLPLES